MSQLLKKNLMLLLISGLLSSGAISSTNTAAQPLDKIIAVVNKTIITESELDESIDKIEKQLQASHTPIPPTSVLRKQVLDQIIDRKLQLDLARQNGIRVTEADITKAITTIAAKNHVTPDKIYASVKEQGMSKADYRKEIQDEMIISQVQQQAVGTKITVSSQEVNDFMRSSDWQAYNNKEYHIEDILIALPETPSTTDIADAKKRAQMITEKLRKGGSFREAAVAESQNSQALQGGDLGWRKLPEVPSAFAGKIVSMKENDIAGPIQTANGFHIIRISGIRNSGLNGSEKQQQKQIQDLLYQRKYEEALQTWIMKLRNGAFINLHPDNH